MTSRIERIRDTLERSFSPEALEVKDDSARHAGHAGAQPEGETHFIVTIRASAFDGMSRVAMHRAINETLAPEFETGLHALTIKAAAS